MEKAMTACPDRRCHTCRHWGRTPGRRVYAHTVAICDAPLPVEHLPDAVRLAMVRGDAPRKAMSRDEGRECPAWKSFKGGNDDGS